MASVTAIQFFKHVQITTQRIEYAEHSTKHQSVALGHTPECTHTRQIKASKVMPERGTGHTRLGEEKASWQVWNTGRQSLRRPQIPDGRHTHQSVLPVLVPMTLRWEPTHTRSRRVAPPRPLDWEATQTRVQTHTPKRAHTPECGIGTHTRQSTELRVKHQNAASLTPGWERGRPLGKPGTQLPVTAHGTDTRP